MVFFFFLNFRAKKNDVSVHGRTGGSQADVCSKIFANGQFSTKRYIKVLLRPFLVVFFFFLGLFDFFYSFVFISSSIFNSTHCRHSLFCNNNCYLFFWIFMTLKMYASAVVAVVIDFSFLIHSFLIWKRKTRTTMKIHSTTRKSIAWYTFFFFSLHLK